MLPRYDLADTPPGLSRPLVDELLEPCAIHALDVLAPARVQVSTLHPPLANIYRLADLGPPLGRGRHDARRRQRHGAERAAGEAASRRREHSLRLIDDRASFANPSSEQIQRTRRARHGEDDRRIAPEPRRIVHRRERHVMATRLECVRDKLQDDGIVFPMPAGRTDRFAIDAEKANHCG